MPNFRRDFYKLCKNLGVLFKKKGLCTLVHYFGFPNLRRIFCYAHSAFHIMFTMSEFISTMCNTYGECVPSEKNMVHFSFLESFLIVYLTSYRLEQKCSRTVNTICHEDTRRRNRVKQSNRRRGKKKGKCDNYIDMAQMNEIGYESETVNRDVVVSVFMTEQQKYASYIQSINPTFGGVQIDLNEQNDISEYIYDCISLLEHAVNQLLPNMTKVGENTLTTINKRDEMTCHDCGWKNHHDESTCILNLPVTDEEHINNVITSRMHWKTISDHECSKCKNKNTVSERSLLISPL